MVKLDLLFLVKYVEKLFFYFCHTDKFGINEFEITNFKLLEFTSIYLLSNPFGALTTIYLLSNPFGALTLDRKRNLYPCGKLLQLKTVQSIIQF